jgi:hypothetical protein
MKLSCLISLVLYAAFVFGYYQWLGQTFEGKELWIASFIVALIAAGGVGALCNSYLSWRDASVLSDAIVDMPRRDGKRTAAAGRLEPLGQPLTAPLSGKPCVLYEYDVFREVTRTKKEGGTETSKSVDFAGIGKTECVVQSTSSRLRLMGFPDLDPIDDEFLSEQADVERARQYVQFTAWEDASGFGIFHGVKDMFSALTGSEEALRKDWRMISAKECAWLQATSPSAAAFPPAGEAPATVGDAAGHEPISQTDNWQRRSDDQLANEDTADNEECDEEEIDEDEIQSAWQDGSGYHPQLTEKRIEPGQQVVVIGRYDEVRQGLVSGGSQTIKIYLEDLQSVSRKLASAKWGYLFGGIITLVIVNLGVWGAQAAYRNSDDAQRHWRESLEKAIRNGDVPTIEKMIKRGVNLNAVGSPRGKPVLFDVQDPAIARLLIERGADVNATDADGMTPLMEAAHEGRSAMLRALIDAGADLDLKNSVYQTTALMMAIDAERDECVDMLRKAGAKDDRVTAENGQPIDDTHEAFAVCREYLAAIFASDPAKLRELSTRGRPARFDDVQWPVWQESRPQKPRLVEGFVRGDDATVTVTGPAPVGADRNWSYQLRREDGKWRVARERWITGTP